MPTAKPVKRVLDVIGSLIERRAAVTHSVPACGRVDTIRSPFIQARNGNWRTAVTVRVLGRFAVTSSVQ
jgi:hypothetical protein